MWALTLSLSWLLFHRYPKPRRNLWITLNIIIIKCIFILLSVGCHFKFLTPSQFLRHFEVSKHSDLDKNCCNDCSVPVINLLNHLCRAHKIGQYQCIYCPNSALAFEPMFLHLTENHSSHPPFVLTREPSDLQVINSFYYNQT